MVQAFWGLDVGLYGSRGFRMLDGVRKLWGLRMV